MRRRNSAGRRPLGVVRDDSDDELGIDDHPWEWIYGETVSVAASEHSEVSRKRKHSSQQKILGARMGTFECQIGDCVLLKAEGGSNEAWVGIIIEFLDEDEDGEKAANFLWFSTEKEIRNNNKKRSDFIRNELYITPSSDINPLASINGKANVMSLHRYTELYPNGKVPRTSPGFNKTFVCRRGCNTRTTSYTEEFIWEGVYDGQEGSVSELLEMVQRGTMASRRLRRAHESASELLYNDCEGSENENDGSSNFSPKTRQQITITPRKRHKHTRVVTPSHRKVVVKKALEFTPLATRVLSPTHHLSSPFQVARARLHVASVPTSLPCRETEFSLVYSHLEAAITDGLGACIYISGTPGTGKTATVREVVARLDEAVRSDELDDFIFVEINGMKITDPHQSYSMLWDALRGQRVSPGQALDLLEREFNNPSPRRVPCVVLMDELDQLVTKNQSVMYNFFNWPGLRHSRLIVLAVANTMDLPERTLSNKISSRLGLTRIAFPGYNHEQLVTIIQSRLQGVPGNIVESDAMQFASRKVAAVSGDARRALDICRRAVEIAEAEFKDHNEDPVTPTQRGSGITDKRASRGRVTIATIKRAINEATTNPLQLYLRALPFTSRLVLAALLSRNSRTGLVESAFGEVLDEIDRALKLDASSRQTQSILGLRGLGKSVDVQGNGLRMLAVRAAGIGDAATSLGGAGIIVLEGHRAERPSKIRLTVGDEEVKLALRDDPEIKHLFPFL